MTSQDLQMETEYLKFHTWKIMVESVAFKILYSRKFIMSQNARIQLLMNLIFDGKNNVSGVIPNNVMYLHKKDVNRSNSERIAAEQCYALNLNIMALQHYSQAIIYIIPNTEMSSYLYHWRSIILYELGMFESCLEDLERVSLIHLPSAHKPDYHLRKAVCHRTITSKLLAKVIDQPNKLDESFQKQLQQMVESTRKFGDVPIDRGYEVCYNPTIPILKNKNPLVPGLSDAVELNFTEDLGRHIIATRDIQPGEIIGVCKPYATVLFIEERLKHCWHCTKQIWNGVPCECCIIAQYCSDYCREKSFEEYHDIECAVTSSLATNIADEISLMTLKLAIKAYKECGSNIDKLLSTYDANAKPPSTKEEVYKCDYDITKFSSVYNLSKEINPKLHNKNSEQFIDSIIIAYYMGMAIGLVKDNKSLIELKQCDIFVKFLGFIEKTLRIVYSSVSYERLKADRSPKIGFNRTTINPNAMLFKHQCFPDITRVSLGEYEVIYAITPLKKGQQIFDSNGYGFHEKGRKDRRNEIISHFGYICRCIACVNQWRVEESKLTGDDVDSIDLKKIKKDIQLLENKVTVSQSIASNYLRKNGKLWDATEIVDKLIKIVITCHKYLQPNSDDFVKAKDTLVKALRLSQVPFITPE
ncbi:SET and MYND domain-containing protein 4-like [Aphidius gifuensis]|uniref:SET and MYND domain-containing protein 4-like n=1 Tax=Aphidius gifuensis TaxID=684658 RepID=UPI001CDBAE08|nr:SET and MYND domain-containing protein 4-like [Aphidius gifuensis]